MGKFCLLGGVLIVLSSASALGGADKGAEKNDPMAALAPFVGEWQVEGQWSSGDKLRARGVYEWGLGKKILKARTFVMNGDKEYQRYESIMAWHPKKKCLYEITFAFDGHIGEVVIEPKDSDTFHIGYTPFQADEPSNVRQILKFKDKDHFQWIVSMKQGEEWKQLIDATWERKNGKN
jgi:hypothetical protein